MICFTAIKKILPVLTVLLVNVHSIKAQDEVITNPSDTLVKKKKPIERPWTVKPASIRVGAFWALNNTNIGAGTNKDPYSLIDFENELGMNRQTYSGLYSIDLRFRRHNRINFSYYNLHRSVKITLDKDIHFGKYDYPIDSKIKAWLNTNILRVFYGYSLISNKHIELGVMAGIHVMSFNAGLDYMGNTQELSYNDNVKFTAPLPNFGIWNTYAFHDHWAINGEISYFGVKINPLDLKGRILNAGLSVQYKLNDNWGFDMGYTGFGIKVDLDRKILQSDLKWNYSGIFVSVTYRAGSIY